MLQKELDPKGIAVFQFQDGSIKWMIPLGDDVVLRGFNSKMVRLNELATAANLVANIRFNSKMVRLNVVYL